MQETLIIYLHAASLMQPSWAIVNAANEVTQTAINDSPEGISQIAEDKTVIVIVPARDVLQLQTTLPETSARRALQALPFAVEDQLIDEIENLHFAVHEENSIYYSSIVTHQKMKSWLELLTSWQLMPDKLVSALFTLPYIENKWQISIHESAIARLEKFSGFATETANLSAFLILATETLGTGAQIQVSNYTHEDFVLPDNIEINKKSQTQWLEEIAKNDYTHAINLLQGRYAKKMSRFPQLNKIWKSVAYLAGAWIVLLFLLPCCSYFILHHRAAMITAQIEEIYHTNFPQSASMVAPKLRMQEKLEQSSGSLNDNKILNQLAYIGEGLSQSPSVKLKHLAFENNQLTVDVNAAQSNAIANFSNFLSGKGLAVKQQNINLASAKTNVSLLIG